MCKAYPGPRCSNHAKKTLDARRADYNRAVAAQDYEACHLARAALKEAEADYESTPAGLKELEEKESLAADTVEASALHTRLLAARARRVHALTAYRRAFPKDEDIQSDNHSAYEAPYWGERAAEAENWSPLKVMHEVKKEIRRAQEQGGLPRGLKLSYRPTDLLGNFRLTVHNTDTLPAEQREEALQTLQSVANIFASRHRQDNWNAPLRQGDLVTR